MKNLNRFILIALATLIILGCDAKTSQMPRALTNAAKPIVVVAINSQGVVLKDADGVLYSYNEDYYFVQTLIDSDLKAGDEL